MKKIIYAVFVVLALSMFSVAGEYKFVKKVDMAKLQTELTAAGFKVLYINGDGLHNVITFDKTEVKNPQAIIDAHVFVDVAAKLDANDARMIVLAKKWVIGTITDAEKDELIKRFIISHLIPEAVE